MKRKVEKERKKEKKNIKNNFFPLSDFILH